MKIKQMEYFTYNISNGKEELIYKLESGYLEFLKVFKRRYSIFTRDII